MVVVRRGLSAEKLFFLNYQLALAEEVVRITYYLSMVVKRRRKRWGRQRAVKNSATRTSDLTRLPTS
jgi:hypothetical protein